ncbi:MAG: tetratricopeptide repeat protein [Acidobacteria bacterium]|nr:MAG: tetratricopeptide repeat protein [Acidobacteriota bacterium]
MLRLRAVHSGRSGQSDQALADLRRAAELEPWNGVGWANLGRVEQATGELEASIVSLRRAVELRPNLAAAWFWLARSLARSGRPEEALAAGLRSLAVEPTYTAAYQFVVLQLRELGRSEEADRYLEHGLRWATEPDSLRAVAAAHRPTDEQ